MMQFSRILTAVLFATHIVVGCCGHHAHAYEDQHQSAPVQETVCPDANSDGQTDDSDHHGPGDCKGARCSFVLSTSPVGGQLNVQYAPLPDTLSLDSGSSLLNSCSERSLFMVGRLLMPVRLHLANQVLLI